MKKYVVEFTGTFFLMLIITVAAVLGKAGDLAGLAIGGGLMALIYGGGHVSRAHYNPAISIAFLLRGGMSRTDFWPYVGAQILGAVLGALAGIYLIGVDENGAHLAVQAANLQVLPALSAEILFTLALAWVILEVATAKGLASNQIYGLAIGSIVMAGVYTVGDISLAVFNPAVAIGLVVTGKLALAQLWIPMVGSVVGAVAASFLFQVSCCVDRCE